MNQQTMATPGANGHSSPHEIFVLSDEQILEIEPESQDVTVREDVVQSAGAAGPSRGANENESRSGDSFDSRGANMASEEQQAQSAQAGVPAEPPAWLADTMNDPQRGADARALWESARAAQQEAAAYREVFARPEEARSAAARARQLDDIDRAYFAGDSSQRAELAAMMLRDDPVAFREMVFAGLRALEAAGHAPTSRSVADALSRSVAPAVGATLGSPGASGGRASTGGASPAPTAQPSLGSTHRNDPGQEAQLTAYAAFEKAANEELERSVGGVIERTLSQALPTLASTDSVSGGGAQHPFASAQDKAAPLQSRLATAIRQDVERALQGDRQLGEQVAQILSAKRLDNETRAQVVRLIGERAQQLVPGAAKRALNDWTQATLATHRAKSGRSDAAPHADMKPAAGRGTAVTNTAANNSPQGRGEKRRGPDSRTSVTPKSSRMDYRKLSDEQILDL